MTNNAIGISLSDIHILCVMSIHLYKGFIRAISYKKLRPMFSGLIRDIMFLLISAFFVMTNSTIGISLIQICTCVQCREHV